MQSSGRQHSKVMVEVMVEVLVEHTWRFFDARSALTESSKLSGAASGLAQSSESAGGAIGDAAVIMRL